MTLFVTYHVFVSHHPAFHELSFHPGAIQGNSNIVFKKIFQNRTLRFLMWV